MNKIIFTILLLIIVILKVTATNVVVNRQYLAKNIYVAVIGCIYVGPSHSELITCEGDIFTIKKWKNGICKGDPYHTKETREVNLKCIPNSDIKLQLNHYSDSHCARYRLSLVFLEKESCDAIGIFSMKHSISSQQATVLNYKNSTTCDGDAISSTYTLDSCKPISNQTFFNGIYIASQLATTQSSYYP
mmetsp:Transcript_10777/g.15781  ORF Transcript_10777/g.15781 Transcript_10777/m.15781 type:complete len:189 (+) Transcript_10777:35-601(+)